MKNKLKIISIDVSDDDVKIVPIYGQGCNYETRRGLEGFQVDFEVKAINKKGEDREFHIVTQTKDRSDNRMAYNGHEMNFAGRYGCDSDESSELFDNFFGYEDYTGVNLIDEAEKIAREYENNLLEEIE